MLIWCVSSKVKFETFLVFRKCLSWCLGCCVNTQQLSTEKPSLVCGFSYVNGRQQWGFECWKNSLQLPRWCRSAKHLLPFFVGLGLVPSLSCYALSKNRFNKCKVDGGMHPDHSLSHWNLFLENKLKPSLSHCQFSIIALDSVGSFLPSIVVCGTSKVKVQTW